MNIEFIKNNETYIPDFKLEERVGEGGFGYDPLFWVESHGKSMAEMSADEKNAISHRGRAVEAFAKKLCEFIKE